MPFPADLSTLRGRAKAWSHSLLVDHAFFRVLWNNFSCVDPGKLYRSNHPTPAQLRASVRRYGIRTVINLRGEMPSGSDALSREAAARLGVAHMDFPLASRRVPHKDRVLRLADVYARAAKPVLVHCKSGADRAGLAAGIYVLLHGGTSSDAMAQLSLRHGHIRASRTGVLDAFFARFAREAEGRKPFLDWVRDDYDEMSLRREFRAGAMGNFLNDKLLRRE
jgi:protein tyrosine/serine phosphatase